MSVINSIRSQIAPIHPQGFPFIGGFALASLILFFVWTPLGWVGAILTCWCAYFFRDPPRVTPLRDGLIVSPADGYVSSVGHFVPHEKFLQLIYAWEKSSMSIDELKRRAAKPGGKSLAEIWKKLGRTT